MKTINTSNKIVEVNKPSKTAMAINKLIQGLTIHQKALISMDETIDNIDNRLTKLENDFYGKEIIKRLNKLEHDFYDESGSD